MTAMVDTSTDAEGAAQEAIGRSLAEDLPEEDAEARAWALLVDLVEEENRRRVLSQDAPSLRRSARRPLRSSSTSSSVSDRSSRSSTTSPSRK